jgi:sirohydrochlorin cobaltochelatase
MKRYRHYNKDLAIVLSCFGSVVEQQKYIDLQDKISQEFGDADVYIAFGSRMVIKKLAKKNQEYKNLVQTLADVDMLGYKRVVVASINLFPTDEHAMLKSIVDGFSSFSPALIKATDAILTKSKYTTQALMSINSEFANEEIANLFIIHGTPKLDTIGIDSIEYVEGFLQRVNKNNLFCSLEGAYPFYAIKEALIEEIKAKNLSKVRVIPLLLVSGNHYEKDAQQIKEELSEHFEVSLAYDDRKYSLIEEEYIYTIIKDEIKEQIKKTEIAKV